MAKGKIEIDVDLCKGCGLCVRACPSDVIQISEQGQTNKYGYRYMTAARPPQCTGCGMCRLMCPDSAITVWRATTTKPKG
ncbi:MAG: ferredoxin family protein [bacterium]